MHLRMPETNVRTEKSFELLKDGAEKTILCPAWIPLTDLATVLVRPEKERCHHL